ncbi:4-hydroxy-tetrahydrodipicolinate reductase [Mesorhizobium sp. M2D.F.Ca.ET.185.01.1.1]|uniref:4-hydroxy-tetrahydrodipicolinate reductase n=1 Tax=unclassified Mesorhizobium TaxID=325217 RepID=UPI000FCAB4E6|nr:MULTISPECIES: 4-hydroxy-tetrahydrodipicolinate reductase [unclassified Mesorhizobium]TGP77013.1 4-hydroxy-tetrahydrodipicolinate reductase [bacterium M00.F.Ca.ET.227.01.1.1]TGP84860.1 4-hydroxy-tetrahydrodipicolinate reductase [bacterium M00.F.Ca.ET.221.01.1.1]TGP88430.1 4-hydroxy-tetrahydrodipicolinate reductase [bacterium M00.F.Ca.ET.222.01.1.1]TGT68670.1 4-hydroxy-tetrahydrodipicolinate reductase [bacterium M00.F.Ca.ET.159.01.1.1]TGT80504.1 4-hydroxy-tetrahydrodipicolinate reductase [bac
MTQPLKIAIAGALGRMGRQMAETVAADQRLELVARFHRPGSTGEGLVERDDALALADVVIDFTTPAASAELATACAARGGPALVIGSTGFSASELAAIAEAAKTVAVVRSGSYSLGLNMLTGLVEQAARALGSDNCDIEILEAHHRFKVDAPSGTALMLGEAAALGRGVELDDVAKRARDGLIGPRPAGEIGFGVLRGGSIVGEHSVSFLGEGEGLTLTHTAGDRSMFARGAIAAALWVAGRPPGEYDMRDVLGLLRSLKRLKAS